MSLKKNNIIQNIYKFSFIMKSNQSKIVRLKNGPNTGKGKTRNINRPNGDCKKQTKWEYNRYFRSKIYKKNCIKNSWKN